MSTTQAGIRTWLGPAADEATDEQVDQLVEVANEIDSRWPDRDDANLREQALSAACQIILGDDTLEAVAQAWRDARRVERDRMAALTGALLASHSGGRYGAGSEADLVSRSGVARMTVRKALGK